MPPIRPESFEDSGNSALGHELAMMHNLAKAMEDLPEADRKRAWLWVGQKYCGLPEPEFHSGLPTQLEPADEGQPAGYMDVRQLPEGHPLRAAYEQYLAQFQRPGFPTWGQGT